MAQKSVKKKVVSSKVSSKSMANSRSAAKATKIERGVKSLSRKDSKKLIAKSSSAKSGSVKPAKAVVSKISASKSSSSGKVIVAPIIKKKVADKVVDKKIAGAKVTPIKSLYKVGNYVVYPTHGVGKIMAEETQTIGDVKLNLLVISFEKDKMTLRVPMSRAAAAGLRPISSAEQIKKVFVTLKSKARTSRGMWSRRAQEYEAKINSGNILLVCEVVRDLHQNVDQSERSYSERMIYESALSRLVGEYAACEGIDYKTANDKLVKLLRSKNATATSATEETVKEVKEAA